MSLSITLTAVRPTTVFDGNLTHNLKAMAKEAGIYEIVWTPHEIWPYKLRELRAKDLVDPLQRGLDKLLADPEKFQRLSPENGWGTYEGLVSFVRRYVEACRANPDATVFTHS